MAAGMRSRSSMCDLFQVAVLERLDIFAGLSRAEHDFISSSLSG